MNRENLIKLTSNINKYSCPKNINFHCHTKFSDGSLEPYELLEEAYKNNETDEFISPTIIGDYKGFEDGDSLIMINFRADRVRELLTALLDPKFKEFNIINLIFNLSKCLFLNRIE